MKALPILHLVHMYDEKRFQFPTQDHGTRFACGICFYLGIPQPRHGVSLPSMQNQIRDHVQITHGDLGRYRFCPLCQKRLASEGGVTMHLIHVHNMSHIPKLPYEPDLMERLKERRQLTEQLRRSLPPTTARPRTYVPLGRRLG